MSDELRRLIEEQERDQRLGDRVHSVSLDAERGDGGYTLHDVVTEEDGGEEGGFLKPRRASRTKRITTLLGHRQRERQRKRMYGGICEGCGKVTDGSNGRAKAPRLCLACHNEKRADAVPHGSVTRYRRGCRCDDCRWAPARAAWDARERAKAAQAPRKDAA